MCVTEEDDGQIGMDYAGVCRTASCFRPSEDIDGKVTICHRTCSENNPWIRITIDYNGWANGHGCGHTGENCNKDPAAWGQFQSDYILKVHGTRDEVAQALNDDVDAIDEYWKHWEPGCPSVRNGQCCFVDEDSEYGYSCCGRALVDPALPLDFDPQTSMPGPTAPFATSSPYPTLAPTVATITSAPTPVPTTAATVVVPTTSAPTLFPTDEPTAAPIPDPTTGAPVVVPTTSAPTPSPTSAPVDGSTSAPVEPFVEPPQCFNRKLQEYSENWGIAVPAFRYQRSLSFHLDFEISDFIDSESMISHTVMDATCTNSYTGQGLLNTRGLRLPLANNRQKVGVALWIDPAKIANDSDIYTDEDDGVESKASVDFCVRFGLFTTAAQGSQEVNFMEVIVKFDADLSDGFEIGNMNLAPLDRCEKEALEAYEVEGYWCNDRAEDTRLTTLPTLNQGQFAKVCVRPVQRALDQGVRIRRLREFTWTETERGLSQVAIENYQAASDGLTELFCTEGYAICHFATLFYASFFATDGVVIGKGTADLQFGGQESQSSVSPKSRRQLRDYGGISDRLLQIETTLGGTAEFDMETSTARSDGMFNSMFDGSDAASNNNARGLGILWMFHSLAGITSMLVAAAMF
mmetsp:Transcript_11248/g.26703  ORF Transcript_11248/g.26703 Transcript_11248/m.26703 type:complete len:634 (+) Transcript_11248:507-2408(+)